MAAASITHESGSEPDIEVLLEQARACRLLGSANEAQAALAPADALGHIGHAHAARPEQTNVPIGPEGLPAPVARTCALPWLVHWR